MAAVRKPADRIMALRKPLPPIVMGARGGARRSRAETALRVLLRVVAVVWMVEGVEHWLGVLTGPDTIFLPAAAPLRVAALFFFCILDFVAAVGLWLVARWGVAVWLATVAGHVLALAFAPGALVEPVPTLLGDAVLVIAWGVLAWIVARAHRLA